MLIASCAILTVAAGLFVLSPLFRGFSSSLDIELMAETDIDRLMDRKEAIYRNIKDLTLEYKMGRLAVEDFRQLEADYKKDAAAVLQQLEKLLGSGSPEEEMEKEIASRKGRSGNLKVPEDSAKCPSCGVDLIPGKKFCADCGYKVISGQ
ncbi:MAG: hypothetical protein P8Z37_14790 [Acidobacteriota bacterium]